MPHGGVHLAVYLGASHACGTVHTGIHRIPVLFDGAATTTPSGVWVDPDTTALYPGSDGHHRASRHPDSYSTNPLALLATTAPGDGHTVDPVDLVAAVLAHVANHASTQVGAPIDTLTIAVPPGWGPRRRHQLATAALRAGLPPPLQITIPAAVATHHQHPDPTPPGGCILHCHLDHDQPPTLTILEATPTAWTELATRPLTNPGLDIATNLADLAWQHATTAAAAGQPAGLDPHQQAALRQATHDAIATLTHTGAAVIPLPPPHPPVVLTPDDLHQAVAPLTAALAQHTAEILDAADIDPIHLHKVILSGPAISAVADALTAASTHPTTIDTTYPHSVTHGALTATPHQPATAATHQLPRTRLRIADLATPLLIGLASVGLLYQTVNTADVYRIGLRVIDARLPEPQLATAAVLATLAGLALAHLAPTTWLAARPPVDPPPAGTLIRRAYLATAATATAVAALYALTASVLLGLPTSPYLGPTLTAAAPATIAGVTIAALAPRIPATALPDWLHHTRPRLLPIALAAGGIWLSRAALTLTTPIDLTGQPHLAGRTGAALIAVATVLTITRQPLLRTITAPILATGYFVVHSITTIDIMIIGYLCAIAWWNLHLTLNTIRAAYPNLTTALRRLTDSTTTPS